jgi:hypothetical protein
MNFKLIKISRLSFFVLISFSLGSCAVLKTHSTKTAEITNTEIIQKPVIVDLDVKDVKVVGNAESSSSVLIEETKNNAVNDALKNANADVLIEPKFDIVTARGKRTVTVTGFPAMYKNFHSFTDKDTTVLKASTIVKVYHSNTTTTTKKKGGVGTVLGAVIGIGLVAIGLSSL